MHSNFSSWRELSLPQMIMTLTATPHPKEVKRESQSPLYILVSRTHSDLSPDVELHTHRITPYHVSPEGQESKGAIHSTKIPTGPTGKSGPPQKADPFVQNLSGWTEPIHWVLDRNFRKVWLNGSRPNCQVDVSQRKLKGLAQNQPRKHGKTMEFYVRA